MDPILLASLLFIQGVTADVHLPEACTVAMRVFSKKAAHLEGRHSFFLWSPQNADLNSNEVLQ